MPHADNEGVRINYETEGRGKVALMMAHGGTGSMKDLRKQNNSS